MSEAAQIFELHRARLFSIAYRMLGTRCDADDVLQDAYLRWHNAASQDIHSPIAFLTTITTRLCLDRLRLLKEERELYIGPWLPEPFVEELAPSPESQREYGDELSITFLTVLERLGPEERAVFLLHDVFDYDYAEVAHIVGKSEAACRQMIHRARPRIRDAKPRYAVTAESRQRLLEKFLAAAGSGDRAAVMQLLSEEAEYRADGGGKVVAALKVLRGPDRIGRLFYCIARYFSELDYRLVLVNGEIGAVGILDGKVFSVLSFLVDGDRITGIYVMRNPEKLTALRLDTSLTR